MYGYCPPLLVTQPMTVRKILDDVSREHGVSIEDMKGPRRFKHYVAARHDAMRRLRKSTGYSYAFIGRYFSRDTSSVRYAIEKEAA